MKLELEAKKFDGEVNDDMIRRMNVRVTSRGRVTIPSELRRKFSITAGARIVIRNDAIIHSHSMHQGTG